jgi:hypothetical protein
MWLVTAKPATPLEVPQAGVNTLCQRLGLNAGALRFIINGGLPLASAAHALMAMILADQLVLSDQTNSVYAFARPPSLDIQLARSHFAKLQQSMA